MSITIKSKDEIAKVRESGRIVAEVHKLIADAIKPGVSTMQLDKIAEEYILSKNAKPSFKGYGGFPATICASINNEVIHGIPTKNQILKDGDIISVDVGALYNGYHGDSAKTYGVGEISDEAKKIIKVTKESFYAGIEFAKDGNHLYEISAAIQKYVEQYGYSIVRDFVGHGVGRDLHEEPQIPNYKVKGRGPKLQCGMVLAIEPMVNVGRYEVRVLQNDWTVVTLDGSLSAHYEHTIAITDKGPELLTVL